ncbi:hypothetical protein [Acidithiobacillus albertensis]|uniref:hypothetical protein n=1 Tax=Acidithiobacillus albertensis TaxID=119978 RepID=UPI000A97E0AB|nr:hypothetical protein [Acidithiobacillus albertensis]
MRAMSRFEENKTNILSGIVVALALVPKAIAFAFVACQTAFKNDQVTAYIFDQF